MHTNWISLCENLSFCYSALQDVKIPPGPRLLILDYVKRCSFLAELFASWLEIGICAFFLAWLMSASFVGIGLIEVCNNFQITARSELIGTSRWSFRVKVSQFYILFTENTRVFFSCNTFCRNTPRLLGLVSFHPTQVSFACPSCVCTSLFFLSCFTHLLDYIFNWG